MSVRRCARPWEAVGGGTGQADGLVPGGEALTLLRNGHQNSQLKLKSIQKHYLASKSH